MNQLIPIPPTLGTKVKTLRTLRQWHQTDLAERSGIPRHIIVEIENNRRILTLDDITALETAFGIKFNDIDPHFTALAPNLEDINAN